MKIEIELAFGFCNYINRVNNY